MFFQIAWLFISYSVVISIGGILIEESQFLWGILLLILFPVIRILNRFRKGKGFYVIGYIGDVGGELATPSGWVTRKESPVKFKFYLIVEILIIGFLLVSMFMKFMHATSMT